MFRQGSTCLVLLWILLAPIRFRLRDFHPLWSDFPIPFFYPLGYMMQSKPHIARNMVWALSISLAATLEIDVSFSSSGYLDVSVHRVPSSHPIYSDVGDRSLSCRVSPFRYPRINRYLLLPVAFRSLSRLSSALSAKASTLRSFLLHQKQTK